MNSREQYGCPTFLPYIFTFIHFTKFKPMRQITKQFKTAKQAEGYLQKLYGIYSHARLIIFPRFTESGKYIFEVQ